MIDQSTLEQVLRRLTALALIRSWHMSLRSIFGDDAPVPVLDREDDDLQTLFEEAGERIKGITEETRARVKRYVEIANEKQLPPAALAKLIREDPSGAFSRSRAQTIARTETATVYNRGAVIGYKKSGRVKRVRVQDNEGPNSCQACKDANGQVWDLDKAEKNPTEHPNCVRSFVPVVEALEPRGAR